MVRDPVDLLIREEAALDPGRGKGARGQVEHVAPAQQLLAAVPVQNGPGIHVAGRLEGDPAGDVGLDQAGDDVHRRPLGRDDQVDARRPGQLGQPADVFLHILLADHHQVRQLVDDDHDPGHGLLPRSQDRVVALQVPDAPLREAVIPLHHLRHRPGQGGRRLVGIVHHRQQQVGNPVVALQLHHLGVHQDQPNLIGARPVEQAVDDCVDAHGFTGARGAGDQQVGHPGQVADDGRSRDVLAQGHRQNGFGVLHGGALQHLPQGHRSPLRVGHLHPHQALARDGGLNPDGGGLHAVGDILFQLGDLAHLGSRGQLQLEAGDGRSVGHVHHPGLHPEIAQGLLQPAGPLLVLPAGVQGGGFGLFQVRNGRRVIGRRLPVFLLRLRFGLHPLQLRLPGGIRDGGLARRDPDLLRGPGFFGPLRRLPLRRRRGGCSGGPSGSQALAFLFHHLVHPGGAAPGFPGRPGRLRLPGRLLRPCFRGFRRRGLLPPCRLRSLGRLLLPAFRRLRRQGLLPPCGFRRLGARLLPAFRRRRSRGLLPPRRVRRLGRLLRCFLPGPAPGLQILLHLLLLLPHPGSSAAYAACRDLQPGGGRIGHALLPLLGLGKIAEAVRLLLPPAEDAALPAGVFRDSRRSPGGLLLIPVKNAAAAAPVRGPPVAGGLLRPFRAAEDAALPTAANRRGMLRQLLLPFPHILVSLGGIPARPAPTLLPGRRVRRRGSAPGLRALDGCPGLGLLLHHIGLLLGIGLPLPLLLLLEGNLPAVPLRLVSAPAADAQGRPAGDQIPDSPGGQVHRHQQAEKGRQQHQRAAQKGARQGPERIGQADPQGAAAGLQLLAPEESQLNHPAPASVGALLQRVQKLLAADPGRQHDEGAEPHKGQGPVQKGADRRLPLAGPDHQDPRPDRQKGQDHRQPSRQAPGRLAQNLENVPLHPKPHGQKNHDAQGHQNQPRQVAQGQGIRRVDRRPLLAPLSHENPPLFPAGFRSVSSGVLRSEPAPGFRDAPAFNSFIPSSAGRPGRPPHRTAAAAGSPRRHSSPGSRQGSGRPPPALRPG